MVLAPVYTSQLHNSSPTTVFQSYLILCSSSVKHLTAG